MQTFLPFDSFQKSAEALHYRHLGKQRVEAYQILLILRGHRPNSRWRNHPAVRMWRGYADALTHYAQACVTEWVKRGYNDTLRHKIHALSPDVMTRTFEYPPWFGDWEFHRRHRANLVRKRPDFYEFEDDPDPTLEYIWPA